MAILDDLFTQHASPSRSIHDYAEIHRSESDADSSSETSMTVSFATSEDMRDLAAIRAAVYDGHLVIVDTQASSTDDVPFDFLIDELQDVVDDVGGDLVQRSQGQLLVAPAGVAIDRQPL